MSEEIKGIDLKDEEMRFFPVQQGIMEVVASTKKKQGYVKLHLPDEMLSDLMSMALGMESKAEHSQYLISYRRK